MFRYPEVKELVAVVDDALRTGHIDERRALRAKEFFDDARYDLGLTEQEADVFFGGPPGETFARAWARLRAGPVIPLRPRGEPRPYYRMEAKCDRAEIYIYDVIGGDFFGDGTTAKQFQKDLKALGDVKALDIFINSPGGDVFDGVAIYNQLARHRAKKIVHIDALAASIASVIAMVGDEIEIAANGMMMVHRAWGLVIGNANDARKFADVLEKIDSTIIGTYVARTGGDEAKITAMVDEETWLTAEEAVAMGFADRASDPVEMAALAKFDLSQFKHVPETLAKSATPPAEPAPPAPTDNRTPRHPHVVAASARVQAMRSRGQIKS